MNLFGMMIPRTLMTVRSNVLASVSVGMATFAFVTIIAMLRVISITLLRQD